MASMVIKGRRSRATLVGSTKNTIPQLAELNIGHYLVGEAIFTGLEPAIRRMRELMDEAR